MSDGRGYKGFQPGDVPAIPEHGRYGREEAAYPYVDELGVVLFVVCRYATAEGKTFLQGRPSENGAGFEWGLGEARRVLYRLDELAEHLESGSSDPVYIVEGEKACDYVREHLREHELGGVVTTSPMGAGKWRPEFTEALTGARHVIIGADLDDPGRKHARDVAAELLPVVDRLELKRPALDEELEEHKGAGVDDHLEAELGGVVTTSPMGAGKWRPEFT
jgi:putative DNA primase/helicase